MLGYLASVFNYSDCCGKSLAELVITICNRAKFFFFEKEKGAIS
jgi:hypothetical protein